MAPSRTGRVGERNDPGISPLRRDPGGRSSTGVGLWGTCAPNPARGSPGPRPCACRTPAGTTPTRTVRPLRAALGGAANTVMNKAQLCQHMVRHIQARGRPLRREEAREFLDELQRVCVRELTAVGRFSITKVAKLVVKTRRPRRGRNPVTGQPFAIPARRVVRARVSRFLRDAVEGPP